MQIKVVQRSLAHKLHIQYQVTMSGYRVRVNATSLLYSLMLITRFSTIANERPAIRRVSLIARSTRRAIKDRSLVQSYPALCELPFRLCWRSRKCEEGQGGTFNFQCLRAPVLDTMGPRRAPSFFSRLGASSSSRACRAGCVLYAWESRARAQSWDSETATKDAFEALSMPLPSDKRRPAGWEFKADFLNRFRATAQKPFTLSAMSLRCV